jgi:hypothetical protein
MFVQKLRLDTPKLYLLLDFYVADLFAAIVAKKHSEIKLKFDNLKSLPVSDVNGASTMEKIIALSTH